MSTSTKCRELLLNMVDSLHELRDLNQKERREFLYNLDSYKDSCPAVKKGLQSIGVYVAACALLNQKRAR